VVNPSPPPTPVPGPSAGQRRWLYLTAAVTGAAIMIVEILGARMLAPYLGTSHFVWTAQITVTLVALASGYYAGGQWVDRSPRLANLYSAIAAAGVWLCASVPACETVAYGCLDLGLAAGALVASAFLFFVPLALLAMAGPFLVRAMTGSMESVGGTVGRLAAVSTVGSVVGTLLIGYVLIPLLPNSVTLVLTALALNLVALGYALGRAGKDFPRKAIVGAALVGAAFGILGIRRDRLDVAGIEERFRGNSNYGLLQVVEWSGQSRRSFLTDYLTQNSYDPVRRQSTSMYTYVLHGLARGYSARIDDVLCIGLGVGIVPMEFAREGVRVDAVEINPAIVPLAVEFFDLDPGQLDLKFGDGRHYVSRRAKRYDVIVLDAFLGDSTPSHLSTREAFAAMRRILEPDGTLVMNSLGGLSGKEDFLTASLVRTLGAVFRSVVVHRGGGGNIFLVASDRQPLTLDRRPDLERVHPLARDAVARAFEGIVSVDLTPGIVLTDDYNPAEFSDAQNREILRRQVAMKMRGR